MLEAKSAFIFQDSLRRIVMPTLPRGTRKFNGETYYYQGSFTQKRKALAYVKKIRRQGDPARMVPGVHIGPKKKRSKIYVVYSPI